MDLVLDQYINWSPGIVFEISKIMEKFWKSHSNKSTSSNFRLIYGQPILSQCRFSLLFLFGFVLSIEASADGTCTATAGSRTEICSVEIEYSGQRRMYQYEIRRPQPGNPTVIEIPGGPGQGYMGQMDSVAAGAVIPPNFGIISIDPRGVGKNDYGADLQGGNYTSDYGVSDIIAVIKKEHLNNYLIHGQSYGTLVATKLASKISGDDGILKPRGIVLSGVVNKYFEDQLAGYNLQIQRALTGFDTHELEIITSGLRTIKEDIFLRNENAFAGAITNALVFNIEANNSMFGDFAPNFKKFLRMLAAGKVDKNNVLYSQFSEFAKISATKKFNFSEVKRENTMAEVIKCTEMSKLGFEADISFDLDRLQFILLNADCAKKGYLVTSPYNSIDYQIKETPVYYFQGSIDPATQASEAKAHYRNQQNTDKVYVELAGYSHTNLLGLSNCQAGLWTALAEGPSALKNVIGKCTDPNVGILTFQ